MPKLTINGQEVEVKEGSTVIEAYKQLDENIAHYCWHPGLSIAGVCRLCMVEVEGKPVAALEISDCNNPPYTLRRQIAEDMRTGACWVRDQGVIRPARREDLDRMYGRGPAEPPTPLQLGFNNDPTCQQLELQVPDSSQSPSSQTRERILSVINTKKASNKMLGYDDTGILRLSHVRIFGPDTPFVQHGMDTLVMQYKQASDDSKEADEHYYFEECAVQINLSIQNPQQVSLQDIVVELSIPKVSGFEVADRLHSSPEKQMTEMESRLAGYPRVDISEKHVDDGRVLLGQDAE